MRTLRNAAERAGIVARLQRLHPEATPRWGRLTAAAVLCHMSDQLRVALGEITCVRRDTIFTRSLGKWLVVDTPLPAPRGRIQTAPEMLASRPGVFDADLAACVALVDRVGTDSPSGIHPTFGPMTPAEWGRMGWKHTDHHLRQYGL